MNFVVIKIYIYSDRLQIVSVSDVSTPKMYTPWHQSDSSNQAKVTQSTIQNA